MFLKRLDLPPFCFALLPPEQKVVRSSRAGCTKQNQALRAGAIRPLGLSDGLFRPHSSAVLPIHGKNDCFPNWGSGSASQGGQHRPRGGCWALHRLALSGIGKHPDLGGPVHRAGFSPELDRTRLGAAKTATPLLRVSSPESGTSKPPFGPSMQSRCSRCSSVPKPIKPSIGEGPRGTPFEGWGVFQASRCSKARCSEGPGRGQFPSVRRHLVAKVGSNAGARYKAIFAYMLG